MIAVDVRRLNCTAAGRPFFQRFCRETHWQKRERPGGTQHLVTIQAGYNLQKVVTICRIGLYQVGIVDKYHRDPL